MSGCLFASVNGRVMGALILQKQHPLGICLLQCKLLKQTSTLAKGNLLCELMLSIFGYEKYSGDINIQHLHCTQLSILSFTDLCVLLHLPKLFEPLPQIASLVICLVIRYIPSVLHER